MSLGKILQGQTRPAWEITVKYDDNSALDITGTTFTGCMWDLRTGTTHALSSGAFAITSAAGGVFTYSPVATDTTNFGQFGVEIGLEISNQMYYVQTDIEIVKRH